MITSLRTTLFPRITISLLLASASAPTVSAVEQIKSTDIGHSVTILGRLNQPLGRIIRIAGTSVERTYPRSKRTITAQLFRVTHVEGKALREPTVIELAPFYAQDVPKLAPDERREFTGYETGRFEGLPENIIDHVELIPAATGWGFYTQFIVTK